MKRAWFLPFFFVCCVIPSLAQIPRTIGHLGVLTDSLGAVKPDGSYTITFRLVESVGSDNGWHSDLMPDHGAARYPTWYITSHDPSPA